MSHQVILLFHGSRVPETHLEANRLTGALAQNPGHVNVSCAFLQNISPSLPDAMAEAVYNHANKITIFPLFTLTGRHVQDDIPEVVSAFRTSHPEISVSLQPHLGADPEFQSWLAGKIQQVTGKS